MTSPDYQKIFDDIYHNYGFGGKDKVHGETRSGPGSTTIATLHIKKFITHIVKQYNVKSVVDIPCGDFNWMSDIASDFESYIGMDISPKCIKDNQCKYPNFDFRVGDLINGTIPDCDLLIVRDVFGHMPLEFGKIAVDNVWHSNWKYLISTNWLYVNRDTTLNQTQCSNHTNTGIEQFGKCYKINLLNEPFNLCCPNAFTYDMKELNKTQSFWVKDTPNNDFYLKEFIP